MNLRCLLASGALLMGAFPLVSTFATNVVSIQFGRSTYNGYALAPSDAPKGSSWNFFDQKSGGTQTSLKNTHGEMSPVTITAHFSSVSKSWEAVGRMPQHLLENGIYSAFGTLNGLDPKKTYDLYFYLGSVPHEPTVTVGLMRKGQNPVPTREAHPTADVSEFVEGETFVTFFDFAPNSEGFLQFFVEGIRPVLSGIQIVERDASEPTPTATPSPTPAAEPPVLTIRGEGKALNVVSGRPVTIRGTATSSIGIRNVWYSTDRTAWRKAIGTKTWHFPASVRKRTRIFVRAEDSAGRFSTVGNVVLVPRPGSGKW